MSVCMGTRVPLNTGVPPMISGSDTITLDFMVLTNSEKPGLNQGGSQQAHAAGRLVAG